MQRCDSRSLLGQLGPGLVAGASDDDPSGIATYSQVGAQFGYGMLWVMLFSYPLMTSIQEISGRLGRVTGQGIAGDMRRYPSWLTTSVVGLLVAANTFNLGADLGAMAAATHLLVGGPAPLYAALFALTCLALQVWMPYERYAGVLKYLSLALLSYVATVFLIRVPWGQALHGTLVPHLSLDASFLTTLIAVLGTTISPYVFFWQASHEVQEGLSTPGHRPLRQDPRPAEAEFRRISLDTRAGMGFASLVAWFIILSCAATLHAHGRTGINTAADAAEALRPIAGDFTFLLFALGIVGTGLLAVPVLAGSAAYAVAEARDWPNGLHRQVGEARGFYGVLAAATLLGLGMNFLGLDPLQALFWTAVINGVVSVPVMVVMMLMACDPEIMTRRFALTGRLRFMGWLTTGVMAAASLGMFLTLDPAWIPGIQAALSPARPPVAVSAPAVVENSHAALPAPPPHQPDLVEVGFPAPERRLEIAAGDGPKLLSGP